MVLPTPLSRVAEVSRWVAGLELSGAQEEAAQAIQSELIDGDALYAYTSKLEVKADLGLKGGTASRLWKAIQALQALQAGGGGQRDLQADAGLEPDADHDGALLGVDAEYEALRVFVVRECKARPMYVDVFIQNEFDLEGVLMCKEDDLADLGIKKGPRVKILGAIAKRKLAEEGGAEPELAPAHVPVSHAQVDSEEGHTTSHDNGSSLVPAPVPLLTPQPKPQPPPAPEPKSQMEPKPPETHSVVTAAKAASLHARGKTHGDLTDRIGPREVAPTSLVSSFGPAKRNSDTVLRDVNSGPLTGSSRLSTAGAKRDTDLRGTAQLLTAFDKSEPLPSRCPAAAQPPRAGGDKEVAAVQAAMARAAETDGAAEEGIREEPQGRGRGPWGGGGEGGSPGAEVLTDSSGDEFHGMPPTSSVAFIYTTEHAPMQMRFRMITITDPLRQHRRHLEAPTNVRRLHR